MCYCDLKPADFPASSPCRRKIGEKVEKDTFQTVNKTEISQVTRLKCMEEFVYIQTNFVRLKAFLVKQVLA